MPQAFDMGDAVSEGDLPGVPTLIPLAEACVRLRNDPLMPGDGAVTDGHQTVSDRDETADLVNRIQEYRAPVPLNEWLRHRWWLGVKPLGVTVCGLSKAGGATRPAAVSGGGQ